MFKTMKMNKIRAFFYIIFFLGIATLRCPDGARIFGWRRKGICKNVGRNEYKKRFYSLFG